MYAPRSCGAGTAEVSAPAEVMRPVMAANMTTLIKINSQ